MPRVPDRFFVIAGLDPAIHMDARIKSAHDGLMGYSGRFGAVS